MIINVVATNLLPGFCTPGIDFTSTFSTTSARAGAAVTRPERTGANAAAGATTPSRMVAMIRQLFMISRCGEGGVFGG